MVEFTALKSRKGSKAIVTVYKDGEVFHTMAGARAERANWVLVVELPESHPFFKDRGAYPTYGGGMGLRTSPPNVTTHGAGTTWEHYSYGVRIEEA